MRTRPVMPKKSLQSASEVSEAAPRFPKALSASGGNRSRSTSSGTRSGGKEPNISSKVREGTVA